MYWMYVKHVDCRIKILIDHFINWNKNIILQGHNAEDNNNDSNCSGSGGGGGATSKYLFLSAILKLS